MKIEAKLKLGQHVSLMDKEFEEIRKTIKRKCLDRCWQYHFRSNCW